MKESMKKGVIVDVVVPLIFLMGFTIIFWITDLDLWISGHFFVPGEGWVYKDMQLWRLLHDYGPFPAILLATSALIVFIASFRSRVLVVYRKPALFFVFLMLLGPGLIVNVIFKEHWDRTRPRNVQEFSGPHPFYYVWQKGMIGNGRSFPSGHAAMGFFLCAPYFVLRKTSQKWAYLFLIVGICCGLTIGLARIVQGRHFASDVIWAGGFVYFCGLGLSYVFHPERSTISIQK